ncbi:hypothetical protein ALI22I_20460 [Saccharothrix sp. ALI-22-I]|uniref:hypothetical protein n=1 Tax=Saccharothrix sp. ALI-22-I TaxID=1933778 RepID=UPI00097C7CCC|nr:hypothetical protein [Saccharothrix sp. ALI-22-I]ONI88114.1 hypothetical protein ALI22I_20460 [Saccharothrix sp. ALI-22-I]
MSTTSPRTPIGAAHHTARTTLREIWRLKERAVTELLSEAALRIQERFPAAVTITVELHGTCTADLVAVHDATRTLWHADPPTLPRSAWWTRVHHVLNRARANGLDPAARGWQHLVQHPGCWNVDLAALLPRTTPAPRESTRLREAELQVHDRTHDDAGDTYVLEVHGLRLRVRLCKEDPHAPVVEVGGIGGHRLVPVRVGLGDEEIHPL